MPTNRPHVPFAKAATAMEDALLDILEAVRRSGPLDAKSLDVLVRTRNRALAPGERPCAKKHLLPFYQETKRRDPARWESWGVDEALERDLVRTLRMKPGRTASGVATVTVLTKPWACASECLYCPNDVRMPKSYLADEPACQRAERAFFDPYLQVAARVRTLAQMGHVTDKVELIVLGGTWSDYPRDYQVWFAKELFRALNEAADPDLTERSVRKRQALYHEAGIENDRDLLVAATCATQRAVNAGELSYNQAVRALYGAGTPWERASSFQRAALPELDEQHAANEEAACRAVGLVIETRPDAVSCESLSFARRLGCTKIQMGVQSLDARILRLNRRGIGPERMAEAFSLLRLFGFKIHVHFMANLYGANPEGDKRDYERLVAQPDYLPDEVKIYPCALVASASLRARHQSGSWRPYSEEELLDVLTADLAVTPPYTRVSRMIRDISAHDIMVGNKKINLRQLVERRMDERGVRSAEIRGREVREADVDASSLRMSQIAYATSVSEERFFQWTDGKGRLAGFLRLSLPDQDALARLGDQAPVGLGEAMIREVHVYGKTVGLHRSGQGAQHRGLGRQLIEEACAVSGAAGYARVNVISAVGTRAYYRALGFFDNGLYQTRDLAS